LHASASPPNARKPKSTNSTSAALLSIKSPNCVKKKSPFGLNSNSPLPRLASLRSSLVTQLQQALALQSRARQSLVKAKQRVEKSGSEEDHATLDALHAGLLSDGLLAMIQNESWSDYHSIVEAFISELDQLAGEKAPDIRVLFGLAPNADAKQIKRRYRELVREHHPDQNGHRSPQEQRRREEVFLRIQAAWDAYEKSPA
jgi:DnaJ-domain-containing protein 1